MVRVRRAWRLASALLCTSGCGQVLGLDDFREAPAVDAAGVLDGMHAGAGADADPSDAAPGFEGGGRALDANDSGTPDPTVGDSDPDEATALDSSADASGASDAGADDSSAMDAASSDSGARDSAQDGPVCSGDLSNIGSGDFQISAKITTTQAGMATLLNQRSFCGPSIFWDLRLWNGGLRLEVDDNVTGRIHYASLITTAPVVNDGRPHHILARRLAKTVTIYVDGAAAGSMPSSAALSQLPPLLIGTGVCVGTNGTVAYVGTVANVCLASP
jgi:hypothetical protein